MHIIFPKIINMSIMASVVIIAVIAARLLLRRVPKLFSYALWAVVLFNLLCPIRIEAPVSLMPDNIPTATMSVPSYVPEYPEIRQGQTVDEWKAEISRIPEENLPKHLNITMEMLVSYLWLAGVAAMLLYAVISYILLRRKLRFATRREENIYETDRIRSPFVLGFIHPTIYLPVGLSDNDLGYILRHERTHIKRRDYLIKPLAFFALALHWFNPLVWLAYLLMNKDMELSCDERVLKEMGGDIKETYSNALLSLATGKRLVGLSPLAFGEGDTKARIKNVLNFKKPSRWIAAVAAVLVIGLSAGFAVSGINNPITGGDWNNIESIRVQVGNETRTITGEEGIERYVQALNMLKISRKTLPWEARTLGGGVQREDIISFSDAKTDRNIIPVAQHISIDGVWYNCDPTATNYLDYVAYKISGLDKIGDRVMDAAYFGVEDFIRDNFMEEITAPAYDPDFVFENKFEVVPNPDKYTPTMSSFPGILLAVKGQTSGKARMIYECESGSFLYFESDKITPYGNEATIDFGSMQLHWTPDTDTQDGDRIVMRLVDEGGGVMAAQGLKVRVNGSFYSLEGDSADGNALKPRPTVEIYEYNDDNIGFNPFRDSHSADEFTPILPNAEGWIVLNDVVTVSANAPANTVRVVILYAETGTGQSGKFLGESNYAEPLTEPKASIGDFPVAEWFPGGFLGHIWAISTDADGNEHYGEPVRVIYPRPSYDTSGEPSETASRQTDAMLSSDVDVVSAMPVYDLTRSGALTVAADSLGDYALYTNSEKITVSIPKTDSEISFELYDAADGASLMEFVLGDGKTSNTFTNLTSAKNYYLTAKNAGTLAVTVTD
jgi:beta-lactamase regulating signal transducer with metallopeptidase domain